MTEQQSRSAIGAIGIHPVGQMLFVRTLPKIPSSINHLPRPPDAIDCRCPRSASWCHLPRPSYRCTTTAQRLRRRLDDRGCFPPKQSYSATADASGNCRRRPDGLAGQVMVGPCDAAAANGIARASATRDPPCRVGEPLPTRSHASKRCSPVARMLRPLARQPAYRPDALRPDPVGSRLHQLLRSIDCPDLAARFRRGRSSVRAHHPRDTHKRVAGHALTQIRHHRPLVRAAAPASD